jgi:MFS family permease
VQGIVGTMPWNAIAFLTLWLQLLGFSDWHASALTAAFYGATSAGAFLGGAIGDAAAVAHPQRGRIVTAQVSVRVRSRCSRCSACPVCLILWAVPSATRHCDGLPISSSSVQALSGVPLSLLLIAGLPHTDLPAHLPAYFAVTVVFGVLISWCGAGCNSPLFAEIVPVEKRSLIYAFDRCFEVRDRT